MSNEMRRKFCDSEGIRAKAIAHSEPSKKWHLPCTVNRTKEALTSMPRGDCPQNPEHR